jgi:hypothetical protein
MKLLAVGLFLVGVFATAVIAVPLLFPVPFFRMLGWLLDRLENDGRDDE